VIANFKIDDRSVREEIANNKVSGWEGAMNNISRSQSLVWGGLLIVFGLMALVDIYVTLSVWVWAGIIAAAGFGVLLVYFNERRELWSLIVAYALLMTATLLVLIESNILKDPFVATFVLGAIALPFLVVFYSNRTHWWALIPAYVLLAIGIMVPLLETNLLNDSFVATYVLATIALPFIVVYVRDRQNWWALIPAYALLAIGIMVGFIEAGWLRDLIIPAYIMFVIAIPFIYVYLRDPREWWPLIPGGVMAVMGLGFLLSERSTRIVAPILVIAFGVLILVRQFVRTSRTDT
jgi:hypothetical protein